VPATTIFEQCGCGKLFAIVGSWAGGPREVFIKLGPQGSCSAAVTNALAMIISRLLRSGVPLSVIADILEHDTSLCHRATSGASTCIVTLGRILSELAEEEEAEVPGEPMKMAGVERKRITGCGYIEVSCLNDSEGLLRKVKAELAQANTCAHTVTKAISRLVTVALAFGLPPEKQAKSLSGIHCPAAHHESSSCLDAIARAIRDHEAGKVEEWEDLADEERDDQVEEELPAATHHVAANSL